MHEPMHGPRGEGHKLAGAVLIALGTFWLAHKAGWLPAHDGGPALVWPLLTILLGIVLVFARPTQRRD